METFKGMIASLDSVPFREGIVGNTSDDGVCDALGDELGDPFRGEKRRVTMKVGSDGSR